MRELLAWIRAIPQSLFVDQEQLSYDVAYGLALLPALALGVFFFRRPAALLIALCFLAGIVCLLALRLARLTVGLPAWVGHKATQPLVASLLVACFLPSTIPPWLGVAMVVLLVVLDTFLWPQLHRILIHPALVVFGVLFLAQRQLGVGFVNAFDLHPLDEPLNLWYRLHIVIDPVKLYVGNVSGPLGATSMAAVLLGIAYLWYTRKISIGLVGGFLLGIAAGAAALRFDAAFQLSSAPALFLAGLLAADRRRLNTDDRVGAVIGAVAGLATMALRARGQGEQATWEALLAVGVLATVVVRGVGLVRGRAPQPAALRPMAVRSNQHEPAVERPAATFAALRPQPIPVSSAAAVSLRSRAVAPRSYGFEDSPNPDDLVRQMRSAATHRSVIDQSAPWALLAFALVVFNPAGLWMTWFSALLSRPAKVALTLVSLFWYAALAALILARLHRL